MSTFTVTIDTENAAFDDDDGGIHEISRLLHVVIEAINQGSGGGGLLDINGNTVGRFGFNG